MAPSAYNRKEQKTPRIELPACHFLSIVVCFHPCVGTGLWSSQENVLNLSSRHLLVIVCLSRHLHVILSFTLSLSPFGRAMCMGHESLQIGHKPVHTTCVHQTPHLCSWHSSNENMKKNQVVVLIHHSHHTCVNKRTLGGGRRSKIGAVGIMVAGHAGGVFNVCVCVFSVCVCCAILSIPPLGRFVSARQPCCVPFRTDIYFSIHTHTYICLLQFLKPIKITGAPFGINASPQIQRHLLAMKPRGLHRRR